MATFDFPGTTVVWEQRIWSKTRGVGEGSDLVLYGEKGTMIFDSKGWHVIDANGKDIGKVDEILGDPEADIWDGLTVSGEYVASERVGQIVVGTITLKS